FPRWIT
ncbi:tail assembly protein I, partial [Escherichia coli 6.0172]